MRRILIMMICMVGLTGCKKIEPAATGPQKMQLALDWHPEPEFGGFYSALNKSTFAKHGLDITIKMAGEGAPIWQLVATGQTTFGTTAGDQVLIARSQGADVVAIFAVYQTCPMGIMTHKARGFTGIADVLNHPGTLEAEDATWLAFCRKKYGIKDVKIIPDEDGIATFLARADFSQQCFVTSEPILAKAQHSDPQTFLIAGAGYNPYTTVVICTGELVRKNPAAVKAMILACREGWQSYLDDPQPANIVMEGLNHDMDAATFAAAAEAQKPLIETDQTRKSGLGTMTAERWDALARQQLDLDSKDMKSAIPAVDCFVDLKRLP